MSGLLPAVLGNVAFINSLLVTVGVAVDLLATSLQNGNSRLGTLPGLVLPPFLGGPGHDRAPWSNNATANGTDYYINMPTTGVTRHYNLTVSRGVLAPDGYQKEMLLVNGQFPGPLLEANWGDYFEITVHNNLTDQGTALHWHGFYQRHTGYMDGVPGISQCPIAPGGSFTYKFRADAYGSSWYHSHYTAQYTDGIYGPIVVYGPSSAPYDLDLGPVLVSDYYHKQYPELVEEALSTNLLVSQTTFADNTLIQGKMAYDCSLVKDGTPCQKQAGIAKFHFESGKTHRLRIINPSTFGVMLVSIDNHDMTVIANDFVPVVPYNVTTITLAAGQRADVLVTGTPKVKNRNRAYYLRVRQPTLCALAFQPHAIAAIYYDDADTNSKPLSLPHLDFVSVRGLDCANQPLGDTQPVYPIAVKEPDTTVEIDISQSTNATGHLLYVMNGETFRANYNEPVLRDAQAGNLSFATAPMKNVYNFGTNETIRIVFKNSVPFTHPMHIHGQDMMVLDEGVGKWDGKTIIRPQNPQRRDTQILQPQGYIVVQLTSDNPGVWPFHCHFAWHVSSGLYINVLQKPDAIRAQTDTPSVVAQTCDAWQRWTDTHVVDQIDSGVKRLRFREQLVRDESPTL